jgi:heterodisulfide reductase subunit A
MGDLRIGVFVCNCGTNIGGFLDVPEVTEYAKGLQDVVFATNNLYSCSETGCADIKDAIKTHKLNRVIVAACTPRTHEPTFRAACEEVGVNPYFFEFVNIREHCSWVHMKERKRATEKAKDLVRMGVARARLLEPREKIEVKVNPYALVIGGGVSGLSAAINLANRGFKVTIIEKKNKLGGILNELYKLYPNDQDSKQMIEEKIKIVKNHPNITVFTRSEIINITGYIGNYDITVKTDKKEFTFNVGTIIVAIGAEIFEPKGMYKYDGKNVVTQIELEKYLSTSDPLLSKLKSVVMIQCVGSRNDERIYCSRICCMTAIKNAKLLKEINPKMEIYILYRDLQTYGTEYEDILRESKKIGIKYIRYSADTPPEVEKGNINVYHESIGKEMKLKYDLLVLSVPLIANPDAEKLSKLLKIPIDANGFFLEAHVKLRPVEFATDGIYLCGCAHWPADIAESISQAYGAASKAAIPLQNERVVVEPVVSVIDEEKCTGCATCVENCPYGAIEKDEETKKAKVTEVICKGCGICATNCPEVAITIKHYMKEQITAQIGAAFK